MKKFSFYTTIRFMTMFTRPHLLPIPWARWIQRMQSRLILRSTWGVHVLRYPNFFLGNGGRWKCESCWRRRGCSLGWARPSGNTVLPVECLWRGRVAVVFLILKFRRLHSKNSAWYPIPPLAWHETNQNSSTIERDMQWWRYGREKYAFVGATVQRRPNVVWRGAFKF